MHLVAIRTCFAGKKDAAGEKKPGRFSHFTPNPRTNLFPPPRVSSSSVNSRRILRPRIHVVLVNVTSRASGSRLSRKRMDGGSHRSVPNYKFTMLAVDLRRSGSQGAHSCPGVMIGDAGSRGVHEERRRRGKTARYKYIYYTHMRRTRVADERPHTCTRERRRSSRSLACAEPRTAEVQLQLCVQAGNAGGGMEAAWWAHSLPGPSILHPSLSLHFVPFLRLSFSPRSPFSPRVSPSPE